MNKADLITKVGSKTGFVRVISDVLAPDNIPNQDLLDKKILKVEHTNSDGTKGVTNVYYLEDKASGDVAFYNQEPQVFDQRAVSLDAQKQEALETYLKANFNAHFINRVDFDNNWAEADTYTLEGGSLTKKTVLVFKDGANPISHLVVV